MRILFLTRKWPPAMGGMEVYSLEMAAADTAANGTMIGCAVPNRTHDQGKGPPPPSRSARGRSSTGRCGQRAAQQADKAGGRTDR